MRTSTFDWFGAAVVAAALSLGLTVVGCDSERNDLLIPTDPRLGSSGGSAPGPDAGPVDAGVDGGLVDAGPFPPDAGGPVDAGIGDIDSGFVEPDASVFPF